MRILVVEDEALIALMLEEVLAAGGHEVVGPAATMEEALALCEAAPPQLALLDITLAGGDNGVDVARALFLRWRVPSIFASSQVCEARRARDIALGCIRKPYAVETVLRSIDAACAVLAGTAPTNLPNGFEMFTTTG
jgi:DNA-binding response OmpR family regulator